MMNPSDRYQLLDAHKRSQDACMARFQEYDSGALGDIGYTEAMREVHAEADLAVKAWRKWFDRFAR